MRKGVLQKLTFISKSLLWSLLLYFLSMAVINWDEVTGGLHKNMGGNVAVAHVVPAGQGQPAANITADNDEIPLIKKELNAPGNILRTTEKILLQIGKVAGVIQ